VIEVLEPKFNNQQALPYGGESGKTVGKKGIYNDSDVLSFMRTRRAGQNIHSDGFLSFGGVIEAAYECECGFRGMFASERCIKCNSPVRNVTERQGTTTAPDGMAGL
jgi:hypothetical protein